MKAKKTTISRKALCAVLCAALVLALAPQAASADDAGQKVTSIKITGAGEYYLYKASNSTHTLQLSAQVLPADAADKGVRWISGSPTIATVDDKGLVTFHGHEGYVLITAEAKDGGGAYAEAEVKAARNVTSMRTVRKTVYVTKGKSYRLPLVLDDSTMPGHAISSMTGWTSSDQKALTVTSTGRVKAAAGAAGKKVTVTAKAYNGNTIKWTVVITKATKKLKKLHVTWPKKARIKKGASYDLRIKLKPAAATGVKYSFHSSNNSVIHVDKAGRLWAKKKGKATITVKAGGKKSKKRITVR